MSKENFTADRVEGFKCEPGKQQSIYWDAKAPGLGLRVTAAGSKSYIFECRLHGKTMRTTIGDKRTWPIGKAQAEATRLKALTDQGIDPRQQEADRAAAAAAKRAEAKRQLVTLSDIWPRYINTRRPKWSARHAKDHLQVAQRGGAVKKCGNGLTAPGPLASLLDVKLSDLSGETIAAWLDKEAQTRPTYASLSFRLLRGCLNWLEGEKDLAGLVPAGAVQSTKVRDAMPAKTVKDDCLQREQLPLWFAAVRQQVNPVQSAYLQGLLLTGARREELARLKWVDVDFKWRSMTIRDKVEGLRIIPLTPYMAHLLSSLPRRNKWVFSSPTAATGYIAEPRAPHQRALQVAGLPHISLHGLRRSFGTLCEWVETPTGIAAQIMGHKPSALAEKHYIRRSLDLLRMWHDKIEAWILKEAGIEFVPVAPGLRVVTAA